MPIKQQQLQAKSQKAKKAESEEERTRLMKILALHFFLLNYCIQ
jgi:hypothetical protein